MKITIDLDDLVRIVNAAISYGGDTGGPYCCQYGKEELIKELADSKLKVTFDKYGHVVQIS